MEKQSENLKFSKPSDFLRKRRPERYSDSTVTDVPQLNQGLLEHHLEKLTVHGEEKAFEYFARRLLEKEICPNLIPQTGPTGGGDSKVDTETYPVSEEISIRWYHNADSAKERWAFAVSAKEDWQTKIRGDVKKIVETNRGYSLIYFITSQFVKDKKRAEVEDDLQGKFGVQVRILDKSWIVDKVITNSYFDIVIDNLPSARNIKFETTKVLGPIDAGREIELDELEKQIKDPYRYQGSDYQLAEDCLKCALLASEMEKSREIVEGLFSRALRIAKKVGNKRQLLRFIYRSAWVYCFVYDDINELSNLYDEVEKLILESDHADDVELASNLFNVLVGSVRLNQISLDVAKIESRAKTLKQKLTKITLQQVRPNNAHQAKTLLCLIDLALLSIGLSEIKTPDQAFKRLKILLKESEGLGEYPFQAYVEIISEISTFADSEAFDELFEEVVNQFSKRKSDGEGGSLWVSRGMQKLEAGKLYEAIKIFGRAQECLLKDEYKEALTKCLLMCGIAYEEAGLLWAARASVLSVLSLTLNSFHQTGKMPPIALMAAKQLAWIEIKLGRIPHIIFCVKLTRYIARHIQLNEARQAIFDKFIEQIDQIFAILLIKADYAQLQKIVFLPHLLEGEELYISEGTVLFALGDIATLKENSIFPKDTPDSEIEKFFNLLSSQSADEQLPAKFELFTNDKTVLKGNILGCNLIFQVASNQVSLLLAETFLAAIEAFMATSMNSGFSYRSEVYVKVTPSDTVEGDFGINFTSINDTAPLEIKHLPEFGLGTTEEILKFREKMHFFVALMLPRIAVFKDIEAHFKRLAEEENVFGRSVLFSDALTLSSNVFGDLDWLDLSFWTKEMNIIPYHLNRTAQWVPTKVNFKKDKKGENLKWGQGEPPEALLNLMSEKHTDRKVLSVINIPLWDKAKWGGAFFMDSYPDVSYPPTLGFLFKNEDAARAIFTEWKKKLGDIDTNDEIRISILRGVNKKYPMHYRVHICSKVERKDIEKCQFMTVVSRMHTMTPETMANLDRFLVNYRRVKAFYFIPAILNKNDGKPEPLINMFIIKQNLVVRDMWEVGEHDEDFVALSTDDDPIIPENVNIPPILKAIERKRKFEFQRNQD